MSTSVDALGMLSLPPALYSGFCGIGWLVEHLTREFLEGDDDLTAAIDSALHELLKGRPQMKPYELIGGLSGFGTYLIERLPHPQAWELLVRVLDHLEAGAEESEAGCTWHTPPAWIPEWQRPRFPQGCYDLGVAHGVPGVLGFLAAAQHAGIPDSRLARLADGAVRWLLSRRLEDVGGASVFPALAVPGVASEPSRTAWCYGDAGIAAVLLSAARSFERPDWEREALGLARLAACRTPSAGQVVDTGICHGTAGLAHLFLRIHQATGDQLLLQAALDWLQKTLDFRRPDQGIGGFVSWVIDEPGVAGEWRAEPGFLVGAAGVGLALLAAVTDIEPAWDRLLLTSVPPQSGPTAEKGRHEP